MRDAMRDDVVMRDTTARTATIRDAATDLRYLLDRGYPKDYALKFVADHRRLVVSDRYVLSRVVVPTDLAFVRKSKAVTLHELEGKEVFVDGYNVIITVESLLGGFDVYRCDDGFLRDVRGVFQSFKTSPGSMIAVSRILDVLSKGTPRNVTISLDEQISRSGELAAMIRQNMVAHGLPGTCITSKNVDFELKRATGIVVTGDGNVIDAVSKVFDLPLEVSRVYGIETIVV